MGEHVQQPVSLWDDEHGELICFRDTHSLADIARWLMSNRSEAEEIHRLLSEMLAEN